MAGPGASPEPLPSGGPAEGQVDGTLTDLLADLALPPGPDLARDLLEARLVFGRGRHRLDARLAQHRPVLFRIEDVVHLLGALGIVPLRGAVDRLAGFLVEPVVAVLQHEGAD